MREFNTQYLLVIYLIYILAKGRWFGNNIYAFNPALSLYKNAINPSFIVFFIHYKTLKSVKNTNKNHI